jgi:hypothetical protein
LGNEFIGKEKKNEKLSEEKPIEQPYPRPKPKPVRFHCDYCGRDAIRAIHSDNVSKFKNSLFETFCHDLGLEHKFSSPYTLPRGVVERKNRTLCKMARTMLDEHRTSRRFWAEAVNTACYVWYRIYLRVHKKITYYKLMHGHTPKVSHFHVFGCKCFILKKGKKLDKFEARSVDGILFGYAS